MAESQQLTMVYNLRNQLQELWSRRDITQAELLEALQEWVIRAEATRVDFLCDFTKKLRSYSLEPVAL